jgi:hypothetical protein
MASIIRLACRVYVYPTSFSVMAQNPMNRNLVGPSTITDTAQRSCSSRSTIAYGACAMTARPLCHLPACQRQLQSERAAACDSVSAPHSCTVMTSAESASRAGDGDPNLTTPRGPSRGRIALA